MLQADGTAVSAAGGDVRPKLGRKTKTLARAIADECRSPYAFRHKGSSPMFSM